jgi:hypothetical protein
MPHPGSAFRKTEMSNQPIYEATSPTIRRIKIKGHGVI